MILTSIVTSIITFVVTYYIRFYLKWRNGPPGPFPFPIIGNLPHLLLRRSGPSYAPMASQSPIYGDIYRFRIGIKDFVVLSSVNVITELYNREEVMARDANFGVFNQICMGKNTGILTSEGPTWKQSRTWTFKMLQKYGHGKGKVDALIRKECEAFLNGWKEQIRQGNNGSAVIELSDKKLVVPIAKVAFFPIIGEDINKPKKESKLIELMHMNTEFFTNASSLSAGLEVAFPILRTICPQRLGHGEQRKFLDYVRKAGQDHLDEVRLNSSPSNESTLTKEYLNQIEKNEMDGNFSDFHFTSIFQDMIMASGDTTAAFLQCILYHCVAHQDWQENIFQEICSTISLHGEICVENQHLMPITEAFILEVHRIRVLLPNLFPRRVTQAFNYKGFTIPKDTVLMPDTYSAHFDCRLWQNPHDFDPTRFFVNGEVAICNKRRRQVLSFGAGGRICPGQQLAQFELFLFLVKILENFKLDAPLGGKPSLLEFTEKAVYLPLPFKIRISYR